ncbi:hypothetical protein OE88DRAFT_1662551 [Heliocybe sulcata]|uniref:Protein-S-isoprenylcysteine O-methyltransferase n=1 Tax=Heliocybe sulcata TaxID=5364 RepID=A0A5C3N067_9AGAM|nr:hypothetical protein OE88DRAFT_1662551 [Heliocybe sulcata]
MSLARVPLLFIATAGLHRCLTNPNPPVPDEDLKRFSGYATFRQKAIIWWPSILKYGLWLGALCESLVLICAHLHYEPYTSEVIATLAPSPSHIPRVRLTTSFIVGTALAVFGSLIRYQCYVTLGKHFTYQLSFRPDQTLVTSGPYSWVRHPSYSAFVVAFTGVCLCWFSEGSWLRECGVLNTVLGKLIVGLSLIGGLGLDYVCLFRPVNEDAAMRKQFGQQWDEWASRVPYKLIPYVY